MSKFFGFEGFFFLIFAISLWPLILFIYSVFHQSFFVVIGGEDVQIISYVVGGSPFQAGFYVLTSPVRTFLTL